MATDSIAAELRKGLRVLTVATLVLYLILFGSMGFLYRDSLSKRHQDARLTSALCALRAAATVAERTATIAALSVIHCP